METKKQFFDPRKLVGGKFRILPPPLNHTNHLTLPHYIHLMKPFSKEFIRKIKVGQRKDKLDQLFGDEFLED